MNIVLATDENFAPFAAAVIASLVRTHRDILLNISILDSGMSEESRIRLQSMSGDQLHIRLHDVHKVHAYVHKISPQTSFTAAIFSRLLIPELLSGEQRAVYLDSDVLALRSLREIYQMDMGGKALCMVPEVCAELCCQRLGIPRYFNSGVILFDLERCRQLQYSRRWQEYLESTEHPLLYPDQDVINVVSQQDIGELPLRSVALLNPIFYEQGTSDCSAWDQAVVVHFITPHKPWLPISHPFDNVYLQTMLETPWAYLVPGLRRRKRLHRLRCRFWDWRRYVSDDREKMRTLYVLGIPIFSRYKSPTRRILYFLGIPFFIWHYPVRKSASPH